MSSHAERVAALLAVQGDDPRERQLLETEIVAYDRWETRASGGTHLAVFADGTEAFHKTHAGLNSVNVHAFGHSIDTPPLHECAAWRFARALGDRYERLLPPTVYCEIDGEAGSLALRLQGVKSPGSAFMAGAQQVADAGFFDLLVGQQDRHLANFLWDPAQRRLGLFDHGFCFPRDADSFEDYHEGRRHRVRSCALVDQRRIKQPRLANDELALLDRLLDSSDLLGIETLLEPDRAAAMHRRIRRLREANPPIVPKLR